MTQLCGEFLRFTNSVLNGSCVEVMRQSEYGIGGYTKEHAEELVKLVKNLIVLFLEEI